jgi:hypothetical protein
MQSLNILKDVQVNAVDLTSKPGIPPAATEQPWQRKGLLAQNTPEPRPGYVQRWIRTTDVDGKPDPYNVQQSLVEGWRPRSSDTLPSGHYATATDSTFGTVVAVMGMVLMEREEALDAHYRKLLMAETDRRTRAIHENQIDPKDQRYAGTLYEQERETSVGGRVAPVDD